VEKLKKVNWKFWRKVGYWLVIAILAVIAGTTAISALEIPNGIRLFIVQSGSMAPSIRAGSIVMIKPFGEYQKGDVITFKAEKDRFVKNPKETATHRIYEAKEVDGEIEYVTKGDFNPSPDATPVKKDLILGKVIFSVPLLGFPVSFARTLPGLIILIVIPGTIIVYSEILNIKKEIVKVFQERKKPSSAKATKDNQK